MQPKIVWQQGSSDPKNPDNLATIRRVWTTLNGKKVAWRQRLIPQSGDISEIDWESQRFDEIFQLQSPDIRGITVYWHKPGSEQERSITPYKIELDTQTLHLYFYPQSQREIVIRVGLPEIIYQKIEITNPEWQSTPTDDNYTLTLRDKKQQLEIKLTLTSENIAQLKEQLPD